MKTVGDLLSSGFFGLGVPAKIASLEERIENHCLVYEKRLFDFSKRLHTLMKVVSNPGLLAVALLKAELGQHGSNRSVFAGLDEDRSLLVADIGAIACHLLLATRENTTFAPGCVTAVQDLTARYRSCSYRQRGHYCPNGEGVSYINGPLHVVYGVQAVREAKDKFTVTTVEADQLKPSTSVPKAVKQTAGISASLGGATAGVALCSTGVGCIVGLPMIAASTGVFLASLLDDDD